jgi:hypothetical protein
MAASVGALVTIAPYDWLGEDAPPSEGDCLLSNGGSAYGIVEVRETRRPNRLRLRCVKLGTVEDIPTGSRVVGLQWYPRRRSALGGAKKCKPRG